MLGLPNQYGLMALSSHMEGCPLRFVVYGIERWCQQLSWSYRPFVCEELQLLCKQRCDGLQGECMHATAMEYDWSVSECLEHL